MQKASPAAPGLTCGSRWEKIESITNYELKCSGLRPWCLVMQHNKIQTYITIYSLNPFTTNYSIRNS